MRQEVSELTLLIYLSIINHKDLGQVLSEYTGCEKEIYTEKLLIELVQGALADISRYYHIPALLTNYFRIKNEYKLLDLSELDILQGTMHWIPIKVWSKEDSERIKKLKEWLTEMEMKIDSITGSVFNPIISCPHCGSKNVQSMYGTINLDGSEQVSHYICNNCLKEFDI